MKNFILLSAIGLIITVGCIERDPIITIVDCGDNNRIDLGKQLKIINNFSPKIIALNYFLVPDSSEIDSIIVKELSRTRNAVQVVGLYNFIEEINMWDSLDISNTKFLVSDNGFGNITTVDSVLVKELPMVQQFRGKIFRPFSYVVAERTFGVKRKYRDTGEQTIKFKLKGLGNNYKLISINDLNTGNYNEEHFRDKIVIVGYMGDKEDFVYLDHGRNRKIKGSEIQAAFIEELIDY